MIHFFNDKEKKTNNILTSYDESSIKIGTIEHVVIWKKNSSKIKWIEYMKDNRTGLIISYWNLILETKFKQIKPYKSIP